LNPQPSILSQKREVVRSSLARIALDLFADFGFDIVTVEEVAAAAGISARTFFRYFASKEEIVLELLSHLSDRLTAAFEARPSDETPVEALRNAYAITSTVAAEDRARVLQVGRILTASPALRQASFGRPLAGGGRLLAIMAARLGVGSSDPRPRILVAAMTAVATAEWNAWVDEDGRGDPRDRIVAALEILERGFRDWPAVDRAGGKRARAIRRAGG
jgi:AcrR family transcriptional regulator